MKILMVSFLPFSGGPGIHTVDYCDEMNRRGHEVFWLYSGVTSVWPYTRIRKKKVRGIQVFELINSPNTHPGVAIPNPTKEVENKKINTIFTKIIHNIKPDIVHVMDAAGLSTSILRIAYENSIPVILAHHSYWALCPKCNLINNQTGSICEGPDNGAKCSECVKHSGVRSAVVKLMLLSNTFKKIIIFLKMIKDKIIEKNRSQTDFINDEINLAKIKINSVNISVEKLYNNRNKYNLDACNKYVALNYAGSNFVGKRIESWGVKSEKILISPMGTRAAEDIIPSPNENYDETIRLGFIGAVVPIKGVKTIIEALNFIEASERTKFSLDIYGDGDPFYIENLKNNCHNITVHFHGPYKYNQLSAILANIDVLIVPPIWFDNSPQTIFEGLAAKKLIVASNIGGIPDFIENNINGLLFEPRDSKSLSKILLKIKSENKLRFELIKNIKPPKTMSDFVDENEKIYHKLINNNIG